ncbi:MAG: hypothetical protein ABL993_05235 [Vicinamibacterales bacterium]
MTSVAVPVLWDSLARTGDAAAEILSTADAKTHLRIDGPDEDVYVAALVKAARMAIEEWTSRATTNQTWVMTLDAFPDEDEIRLPRPPLSSVTTLQYVDGAGATQTWSSANYTVVTRDTPGRIRLAYGVTWPATREQPDAVTITYVAGYGAAASSVPAPLVHAARLVLGDLYGLREAGIVGTVHAANPAVDALLAPYIVRMH